MDVISTADVSAGERMAYWREMSSKLCAPYELRCERELESEFWARAGISDFGPVQAALMTSARHTVHRTPKLIRQSDPEVFKRSETGRSGATPDRPPLLERGGGARMAALLPVPPQVLVAGATTFSAGRPVGVRGGTGAQCCPFACLCRAHRRGSGRRA
ncbi:hypothetical protein ACIBLA_30300 [Streptomyces sp. NPDC050433]|uniref:hypothetical protein n=1 Tax=Streptomyces sp. NPDC050433 TaxID=3365615 RepID=UPI0037902DFA